MRHNHYHRHHLIRIRLLLILFLLSWEKAVVQGDKQQLAANEQNATRRPSSRIVNGDDAPIGRFPYMVSLQLADPRAPELYFTHLCGGTLIAPDIVLSAAHCKYAENDEILIRTNPHSRKDPSSDSEVFGIIDSALHPHAFVDDFTAQTAFRNDLWVIKLDGMSIQPLVKVNEDPSVPLEAGQPLTAAGWGDLEHASSDPAPDILQFSDELLYVPKEECQREVASVLGRPNDSTLPFGLDDELCAFHPTGEGTCHGDSGGPILVQGETFEEDIQVGTTSYLWECGARQLPSVSARTSWGFQFIRHHVCTLSDAPPDYFRCDEPLNLFTAAPTVSPAPTTIPPNILVQMKFDGHPYQTHVLIYDENDIPVFAFHGNFLVAPSSTRTIALKLDLGKDYKLSVQDSSGDGLCCGINGPGNVFVFMSDIADYDNVLAYVDEPFNTTTTNRSFTVSEENLLPFELPTNPPSDLTSKTATKQNVTVLINFDTYSSVEIFWRILKVGAASNVRVHEVLFGTYTPFDGDAVTDVVTLELDEDYIFEIYDVKGDGICCSTGEGYIEIYFGTELSVNGLLMFDRGDFGFFGSQNFTVATDATISVTESPSTAPSSSVSPSGSASPTVPMIDIVIQIQLDLYSGHTGWYLTDADGNVVASEQHGTYSFYPTFSGLYVVNETVSVMLGAEYTFVLYDAIGDGIFCSIHGMGCAAIFYEDAVAEQALVYLRGNFEYNQSVTFIAAEVQRAEVTPGPIATPASAAPTTAAPAMILNEGITAFPTRVAVVPASSREPSSVTHLPATPATSGSTAVLGTIGVLTFFPGLATVVGLILT